MAAPARARPDAETVRAAPAAPATATPGAIDDRLARVMGEAIVGVLLLATALLFAFPRTRPVWWLLWHRLRKLLILGGLVAALIGLVGHGLSPL